MKKILVLFVSFLSFFILSLFVSSCANKAAEGKSIHQIAQREKLHRNMVYNRKHPTYDPKIVKVRDTIVIYSRDSIYLPQYVKNTRKYSHWYVDGNQNTAMLNEACDFNSPYTRKFALDLAAKDPGYFNVQQVCNIYEYCLKNWSYVNDPYGTEYVASASETIENKLKGDCDDFAVLLSSCILAVGGNARVVTVTGHAYAEWNIGNNSLDEVLSVVRKRNPGKNISRLYYMRDNGEIWLSLDWGGNHIGSKYLVDTNEFWLYEYSPSIENWKYRKVVR